MTRHPHDLPFEENPEPVPSDIDGIVATSLVVLASTVETVIGRMPALVFRFHTATREALPDVVLLLDPGKANDLPALVTSATAAAVRAARR